MPGAAAISAEAFELDISTPETYRLWERRVRHALLTDPEGAFVTEHDGRISGVAQAMIRDGTWILSLLTVSPTLGRGGEGRALLNATLGYGADTEAGIIIASNDPRALRLYGSSGFRLEPTFEAEGRVDPALIPELHPDIERVPHSELERLEPISRAVRGAAHTQDLAVAAERGAGIFALADRGFVITSPGRGVWLLAARDEQAARALLWFGLDQLKGDPRVEISFVSGRQQWALEVFLAARLPFKSYGAIATRGDVGPLYPYIPSPPFA